jgi:hypothetical protein
MTMLKEAWNVENPTKKLHSINAVNLELKNGTQESFNSLERPQTAHSS